MGLPIRESTLVHELAQTAVRGRDDTLTGVVPSLNLHRNPEEIPLSLLKDIDRGAA